MSVTFNDAKLNPRQPQPTDRLWFDPRVLALNTSLVQTDYTLVGGAVTQIAKPSVRRVMVGFYFTPLATNVNISPWPDVNDFAFINYVNSTQLTWFTLFDFGPLVMNGWFALTAFSNTVRVVEITRN